MCITNIRDHLFSDQSYARLTSKIELVADNAGMMAEDDDGRSYDYSTEGFPRIRPEVCASEWLEVQPDRHASRFYILRQIDGAPSLRQRLIEIALEWQGQFGIAPQITTPISEYDAAMLVGMPEDEYSKHMQNKTAVAKGSDFEFNGVRYQVKGNRPSGKPGSKITKVPKASNYEWDVLIWIMYDKNYVVQEAWAWNVDDYRSAFHDKKRLSPDDYRWGKRLA